LKAPKPDAQDLFLGDLIAGPDTAAAENTFGKVSPDIGVVVFRRIITGFADLKTGGTDLQLSRQFMKRALFGVQVRNTGPGMGGQQKLIMVFLVSRTLGDRV
jgi:hypothetical protein